MKFARNGRVHALVLAIAAGAATVTMIGGPALAATVTADTVRTGGAPLKVRASARSASTLVGTLPHGHRFAIACQVIGERVAGAVRTTVAWDRLTTGAFVSDAYVVHPPRKTFKKCAPGLMTKGAPLAPVPAPKAGLSKKAATFLTMIAPAARQGDREYKVPASVTMAQAILESGWGLSKLTANDKNYFGIKCFGTPGAIAVSCHRYVTNECDKKTKKCYSTTATFRVYRTVTDSFRDHAVFLQRERYKPAFGFINSPDKFAAAIHKAGYATDPNYTTKLVNLMKQYDLYRYDV